MKIISTEYLPRNLKILSIFFLVFSLLTVYGNNLLGLASLLVALSFFSLSIGVKKNEKWSAILGLIYFASVILSLLATAFLDTSIILYLLFALLVNALFLISFTKFFKKDDLSKKISIFPFAIVLLTIILVVIGVFLEIYSVFKPL
jgi:heme O synthase-like polyprenyltransferase